MPLRSLPHAVLAAAVLLSACGALGPTIRPRGGVTTPTSSPQVGATPIDPGRQPTADPGRTDTPASVARPTTAAERRVCRASAWPTGYVAVAYETAAGDECPRGAKDAERQVAVLHRFAGLPPSSELDVCADAHVPFGWYTVGTPTEGGPCPGAVANGGSATKRIRRLR